MPKPPLTYYGGKTSIAEKIVRLLPAHEHYVEPYCGSLAVLLAKKAARIETVNDLDEKLMTFWRVLRDRPLDLERVCALTPHSRAELAAAYEPAADELEVARRVWVVLTQGRSGTLRDSRTGWRHIVDPSGGTLPHPGYLRGWRERMAAVAERLAAVSLECRPALQVIDKYGRAQSTLLYVDPPYLGSSRAVGYRHEMRSDAEHRELAQHLAACRSAVVLSGYHSPLYDELYNGWHVHEMKALNTQAAIVTPRTEVLWSNRPFPNTTPSLFDEEVAHAS